VSPLLQEFSDRKHIAGTRNRGGCSDRLLELYERVTHVIYDDAEALCESSWNDDLHTLNRFLSTDPDVWHMTASLTPWRRAIFESRVADEYLLLTYDR